MCNYYNIYSGLWGSIVYLIKKKAWLIKKDKEVGLHEGLCTCPWIPENLNQIFS